MHSNQGLCPDMCPGQESNWWPFALQDDTQPTKQHRSELMLFLSWSCTLPEAGSLSWTWSWPTMALKWPLSWSYETDLDPDPDPAPPAVNIMFPMNCPFLHFIFIVYTDVPIPTPLCLPPLSPHPRPPPSLWPSPHCCLCLWVMYICFLVNPFTFFHPCPMTVVCSMYPCLFQFCLVSSFCSLDSTYKWEYMVFVFLWLAYFSEHNNVQVHPCCHKR